MAATAQQTNDAGRVDYALIGQQNDAFRKRLPEGGEGNHCSDNRHRQYGSRLCRGLSSGGIIDL